MTGAPRGTGGSFRAATGWGWDQLSIKMNHCNGLKHTRCSAPSSCYSQEANPSSPPSRRPTGPPGGPKGSNSLPWKETMDRKVLLVVLVDERKRFFAEKFHLINVKEKPELRTVTILQYPVKWWYRWMINGRRTFHSLNSWPTVALWENWDHCTLCPFNLTLSSQETKERQKRVRQ